MNTNPINTGIISENFIGIGTVTPEMVAARARELALIDGRHVDNPSPTDYAQATRELTGLPEMDPREAFFDSIPESEGEEMTPPGLGVEMEESPAEDEGSEGESEGALLFLQGMNEADHDRRLQAARAVKKEDERQ